MNVASCGFIFADANFDTFCFDLFSRFPNMYLCSEEKRKKKKSKITEAEAGIDQSIQSLLPQPYCKSNHAK